MTEERWLESYSVGSDSSMADNDHLGNLHQRGATSSDSSMADNDLVKEDAPYLVSSSDSSMADNDRNI